MLMGPDSVFESDGKHPINPSYGMIHRLLLEVNIGNGSAGQFDFKPNITEK
jgi:hypothetical protein